MNDQLKNMSCMIITEGIAGTENQCIGVAEALGLEPRIKRIKLREPWKSLSPWLGFESWWAFDPLLFPPWPDLLITSGRKSIAASRYIKKMSDGQTFTLHIQDPKVPPSHFNIVAVPKHDELRGKNVLVTIATPNRVTEQRLREAKLQFKELTPHKKPCVAVLIGGNSKTHKITDSIAQKIVSQLLALDASLYITVSRRTPEKIRALLAEKLKGEHIYFWNGEGENPYFAFLGFADYILVTNDSASMLSEAATTGKPVYSIPLQGSSEKFARFYKYLKQSGAMRIFEGKLESWEYEPLQDAQKIAEAVEKSLLIRIKG